MDRPRWTKGSHLSDSSLSHVERRRGKKWHFGNPNKRRDLVRQFAQSSTVHGTAYVCSTGSKRSFLVKIIYRVLFVVCFLCVISNITTLLQEGLSKHSTFINTINRDIDTGIEEDPDWFPRYPRITICRRPFYKIDESHLQLIEYVMLSLGFPFTPLSPQNVTLIFQLFDQTMGLETDLKEKGRAFERHLRQMEKQYLMELKKTDNFDLEQFVLLYSINCSDFFISCLFQYNEVECCELFQPVITNNGVCFTMSDVETITKSASALFDFLFVIDLTTPNYTEEKNEFGYRVFFTDPKEDLPSIFSDNIGQDVLPRFVTTVKAQLMKKKRTALHTPWHSLWDTCPRFEHNETYSSDRYSFNQCHNIAIQRAVEEVCNCQYIVFESGSRELEDCDPKKIYECMFLAYSKNNVSYACQEPCIAYSYKTESSYIHIGGSDDNVSRLKIIYDSKQYMYNEYRQTTISSLLSQIGGSLGLYLGASIITLFEIVTFTASWLWYRLVPDSTTKVHPPLSKRRH